MVDIEAILRFAASEAYCVEPSQSSFFFIKLLFHLRKLLGVVFSFLVSGYFLTGAVLFYRVTSFRVT